MSKENEGVLARWSRRKAEARNAPDEPGRDEPAHLAPASGEQQLASRNAPAGPSNTHTATHDPAEPDMETLDIDALDASSDYTRFMGKSVPADVRSGALRKLWTSDPVFSLHDGLDDCCGDYTDAQWATGAIATAYRVGKGMLTDEEIAAWERRGRPNDDVATAHNEGAAEVAGEPSGPEPGTVSTSTTEEASASPPENAAGAAASAQASVEPQNGDGQTRPQDALGEDPRASTGGSSTPS